MMKRTSALIATGALLAVPTATLIAAPQAHAEDQAERHGACGGGRYELTVGRERGGWEMGIDLDNVAPGSRWRIVMKQDGKTFFAQTRRADRGGDIDVERNRSNTPGKDRFRFVATRVGGSPRCAQTVVVG